MIRVFKNPCPIHSETIGAALGAEVVDRVTDGDWMVFPFVHPGLVVPVDQCKKNGIKTVAYWLGGDVNYARNKWAYLRALPEFDVHIAVHQRLSDELDAMNIKAEVVPFLARQIPNEEPPEAPRVAVYIPSKTGKYGFEPCVKVAAALPELPFVFYGLSEYGKLPKNAESLGRLTPEGATSAIGMCTVVLRLSEHDGFPQNVIEAKMMGRQAVTSYPYEGCISVSTFGQALNALRDPQTHEPDTTDWPQWYRDNCSPEAFARNVQSCLKFASP